MADSKKQTPADDIMATLMKEISDSDDNLSDDVLSLDDETEATGNDEMVGLFGDQTKINSSPIQFEKDFDLTNNDYEKTRVEPMSVATPSNSAAATQVAYSKSLFDDLSVEEIDEHPFEESSVRPLAKFSQISDATVAIDQKQSPAEKNHDTALTDSEKTIAVTGFQVVRPDLDLDDKVKVSVGQNRTAAYSSGYAAWGNSSDSNLAQAENLRIAQDKILEIERQNEQLRRQNEELISASEIIKERSDLLTAQVTEFRNDREGLEESFKNEMTLLKNHLVRKDAELQRAQFKVDELESRLKFDMKKIRVRERELENRLELIRAEKNAIVKNKDEQILDLRRKMDIVQMEVDSYRQKCVELNKLVEINQESFKRTTRALRLAMANLELQDENKVPLKKVD